MKINFVEVRLSLVREIKMGREDRMQRKVGEVAEEEGRSERT